MISVLTYVTRPIAALLVGIPESDIAELVHTGRLKRYGGARAYFAVADLNALRPEPITADDMDFAEAMHARRLQSYARQNAKRQKDQDVHA